MPENAKWITTKEASAYLREQGFSVKPPTIRAWIREGRFIDGDRIHLGSSRLAGRVYTQQEYINEFLTVFENLAATSPIPRIER